MESYVNSTDIKLLCPGVSNVQRRIGDQAIRIVSMEGNKRCGSRLCNMLWRLKTENLAQDIADWSNKICIADSKYCCNNVFKLNIMISFNV